VNTFNCTICRETFPADVHMHEHHIVPRSVGGTDHPSNIAFLCPGCHDALHRVAYKLVSKDVRVSEIDDFLMVIYKDVAAAKMCLEFAKKVAAEIIAIRERGGDPDDLVPISTMLRRRDKDRVAALCREQGMSMETCLRFLIIKHLLGKYGVKPAAEEAFVKSVKLRKKRSQ
jgi:hypothetical protein